jgi:RimJ/RimL family protein N-acetyltransferase
LTPVWTHDGHPAHEPHWQWASFKLFGDMSGFGPCTTMGVQHDGELVGVVVFHNFNRKAGVVEISGVSESPRWLSRSLLLAMFGYVFDKLGCQMAVMRVAEDDSRLMRILTAYGFDHIHLPRMRGRNEGENLYTLTEEDWRGNGFHKQNQIPPSC